jgi:hypothetical protein
MGRCIGRCRIRLALQRNKAPASQSRASQGGRATGPTSITTHVSPRSGRMIIAPLIDRWDRFGTTTLESVKRTTELLCPVVRLRGLTAAYTRKPSAEALGYCYMYAYAEQPGRDVAAPDLIASGLDHLRSHRAALSLQYSPLPFVYSSGWISSRGSPR